MYEAGISDHYKTIFSVLIKTFAKSKRKIVFYRCYKKHDQNSFKEAIQNKMLIPNLSFEQLHEIFWTTLDAFASYMQKKIRYKNNPLIL